MEVPVPITLHHITEDELPALQDWLGQYLPEAYKLYFTVTHTIEGVWSGQSFLTLGWPEILAVGEGPVPETSPAYNYHKEPRATSVFSPNLEHLETLLRHPEFFDWSKPAAFQVVSAKFTPLIRKIAREHGGDVKPKRNVLLQAGPEDLPLRPVPEGFEIRELDPNLHTDFATWSWPHKRRGSDKYTRALLTAFPSVGLFEKSSGDCVGLEIGAEFGALGMLFVKEEFRGRGFGKIITSHLAQRYFQQGRPALAYVIKSNDSSIRMHLNCGFKESIDIDWVYYVNGDLEEFFQRVGYTEKS